MVRAFVKRLEGKIKRASEKSETVEKIGSALVEPIKVEKIGSALVKPIKVEKIGSALNRQGNIDTKFREIETFLKNDREFIINFPYFEINRVYYENNRKRIMKKYGGKIILIHNQKIHSVFSNFNEFSEKIKKISQEILNRAFITRVPTKIRL